MRTLVPLAALLVAAACGSAPRAKEPCRVAQPVRLVFRASEHVNPDEQGRSLASVVRIYLLKDVLRLENAEFEDIWLRAQDTLGEDLVKVDELTVFPDQELERTVEVPADVSYLIGVALFRKPAGVSWRAVYALPVGPCRGPAAPATRRFYLEDYRIEGT